jgi:pyridoxamine 5'-phosphate oxidase
MFFISRLDPQAVSQKLDRYHESLIPNLEIGKLSVDTPLLTAPDIRQRIWQELQRAVNDRHHEWRTPVLATVGADATPQARTVVLRHADVREAVLQFYTDSRSPKVAELEATHSVTLVFWSKRLSWQLRTRATATVQRSGTEVEAVWARVSQSPASGDYLSTKAPGEVLNEDAESGASDGSQHHFAIITLQVQDMDWLELARTGHRRAVFTANEWEWRVP